MLKFDNPILLPEVSGVIIYRDSNSEALFYVMPDAPRFRIEDGKPILKFIKYRVPIERGDGKKKGGGFVFFDTSFDISAEKMTAVKEALQAQVNARFPQNPPAVTVGNVPWLRGTARMVIDKPDGTLVEQLFSTGKPSLFGRNIATFAMELSDLGATFFEQALQGNGGVVSVVYDLFTMAQRPPLTVNGHFSAEKFYSFNQSVSIDFSIWHEDTYNETVREQFRDSSSYTIAVVDPGGIDPKIINQVRDWATRTMEDNIEKKMIEAIAPVTADGRKVPDGIDKVTRDISTQKIASFDLNYTEFTAIEWNPAPQGTLPNITTLKGPDGQPLKWADFAQVIDLDDPFFRTLDVTMLANADFMNLPIANVEVSIEYPINSGNTKTFVFDKPDLRQSFQAFVVGNDRKFNYSYQVNYKGSRHLLNVPPTLATDNVLTVNVDDMGYLHVLIQPGDIDFEQVSRVQITMQYQDQAKAVGLIEQQFTLDKDHTIHKFEQVIGVPVTEPYTYLLTYTMKDGKEYKVKAAEGNSPMLFINDPFSDFQTISVRAVGDLDTEIDTIFVDLTYHDETNNYTQKQTVALSKTMPFFDWKFPVIDAQSGKTTYSGSIRFKNGMVEDIAPDTVTRSTLMVGKKIEALMDVQIVTDLLDFEKIKLVLVSLQYTDPTHQVDERQDFQINKATAIVPRTWLVSLKDKTHTEYSVKEQYFLTDGTKKTKTSTTSDGTLVLELPA